MNPNGRELCQSSSTAPPRSALAGRRIHMIGIGGAGMIGVARMFADMGASVSGSDMERFDGIGGLVEAGIRVSIGHHADHLNPAVDEVIISAAIPESNPELIKARREGIPVRKYAQAVGALMTHREGVCVAGTHGKSTTTALCAHVFREGGFDPSFVVGATSAQLGGSSAAGSGPHFIVESCEFDRSFLQFYPKFAAVLNIELDHPDCYRDVEEIVESFSTFCGQIDPAGLLVCNAEDRWALKAALSARCELQTFGFSEEADWRAVNLWSDLGRYAFDVHFRGTRVLSARMDIPGRHNVANALAAVALAHAAGVDPMAIGGAVSTYEGVSRRMTWRGRGRGVVVIDDYAHHPTEVKVTIEAARCRWEPKRTWVIFQPHQRERTLHFLEDFAGSFAEADEIVVLDVYNAREGNGESSGIGSRELVSRIHRLGGRASYLPSFEAATGHVVANLEEGDLVLTMGAGDVWKVADELVERICEPSPV